jgi:ketosteroid isomerase-like protein
MEGDRPALSREVWAAMGTLLRTDRESFIRHGLSQVTAGSVSEDAAGRMIERFPNSRLAVAVWDALGEDPESVEDDLAELGLPMLFGQHAGCLSSTEEGFADIVARFPQAATVSCPEACGTSPTFAEALREFCVRLDIVRRVFDEWAQGDFSSGEFFDPNLEFDMVDWPGRDKSHGLDEMREAWMESLAAWDDFRAEAVEFIPKDEHVLVLNRITARGKGSGADVRADTATVFTFADTKVVRLALHWNVADALEAVGLPK